MSTLLDRLGGVAIIEVTVDEFYRRVLGDPLLAPMFEGVSLTRVKAHQRRFLAQAFGGPGAYRGRDLGAAHRQLVQRHGLGERHFDAVLGHLDDALAALGVALELRRQALEVAESARAAVLGRLSVEAG